MTALKQSSLSSLSDFSEDFLKDFFNTSENIQWAYKSHCNAKEIGFYWTSAYQILDNISAEVQEVREVLKHQESTDRLAEEIGDLYLGVVELCYYLKLNPETILQNSLTKFDKRLNYVKELMKKRGIDHFDANSTKLALELWAEAKKKAGAVEED